MNRSRGLDLQQRLANLPRPTYPDELPVVLRREEIARAIDANQVVIVCGETGSGKTTQLPKICLDLKRGIHGLIGHTQPRRIAARTVAARVAQELKTELGRAVGYKIRFTDRVSPDTYIKLMTDGILLAETQGDRLLKAYDTLIIDEAHERSLNIDFLLGYLKEILPQRPDLKIIVTSATIDAERFATHFANGDRPAPVIEVSGRMYPVELRYRPLKSKDEDDEEQDMEDAIVDAVDDLARAGSGDILVFLPGEREIRETAELLRKHHPKGAEILPLYARLSFEEQDRVFKPHGARRIVLATNVAETSLTVPGIRYVIDTGLARINRYSYRNKVEQLQVEKISRASANQRAGRCGRVAAGICVRLYAEDDYAARSEYTDPEVLRTSLAAVILRMKSLKIGEVERFPFLEAPNSRAIADGYQLLAELGAVDEDNALTDVGWQLAKFPIDPRVARMIIAAQQQNCLAEILVIASALSVQDPRERPFERADAADKSHERFADDRSDFLGFLKLWDFFNEAVKHKKSNRKLIDDLHALFLSHRRLREWRDIHGQLHSLVGELKMNVNGTPATYEQIHRALLAGLLGNIGFKSDDGDEYLGARGIRFAIFPGSVLRKAKPKWVVAAEITETTRLYARCVAKIEPEWLETMSGHLVKRHYFDPHWEKERAMVTAYERVTLYGLTIVAKRRVHYGPLNPREAREIFIRQALTAGNYETRAPFFTHNQQLVKEVQELEHKTRRRDVLVDEATIVNFYDDLLPPDIYNGAGFDHWRKEAEHANPKLLFMTREYLMRQNAAGATQAQFPDQMDVDGVQLKLRYRFEPAHPLDGVTVTVPLAVLNQLQPAAFEWLVPGLIREKVGAYLKALPKAVRKQLLPLQDQVTRFLEEQDSVSTASGSLLDALARYVKMRTGEIVSVDVWDDADIPPHLRMNYRVIDDAGRELATGRELGALKAQLGQAAQLTFAKAEPGIERSGLKAWDFGDVPAQLAFERAGRKLTGYPALADDGDSAAIRLFDTREAADASMRGGVIRLLRIDLKEQMKQLDKSLPGLTQAVMQLRGIANAEDLKTDLVNAICDRAFIGDDELPRNQAGYEAQRQRARTRLPAVRDAACRMFTAIADEYHRVSLRLANVPSALNRVAADLRAQLQRLVYKGFLSATPWEQLQHLPRYLKAVWVRLEKYAVNPERDEKYAGEIAQLWKLYQDRSDKLRKAGSFEPALEDFRWQLEELRVSLFAQELRTPFPVSIKRLKKIWETLVR
ncbi:MAG: ATP-dependent helicase [Betaproteobacteria bacterium]|nr:ATP-dependent helicase [Betaproteobacteria bacterium]